MGSEEVVEEVRSEQVVLNPKEEEGSGKAVEGWKRTASRRPSMSIIESV